MNTELLKARQTKYVAYATLYIVVTLAVVTVANVLADRYDKSYDATSNKRYSLSPQTVKIVKGLKQDATITYYDQATRFQPGKDKLDFYADLSPKVHVDYVDPDKNRSWPRSGDQELRHDDRSNRREKKRSEKHRAKRILPARSFAI